MMGFLDIICVFPDDLAAGIQGYELVIKEAYDPSMYFESEEPSCREEIREAFSEAFELIGDGSHEVLFSDELFDI